MNNRFLRQVEKELEQVMIAKWDYKQLIVNK